MDSVVISKDESSIMLPGGGPETDAIDRLIAVIKGAIAITIEGEDWYVLVSDGEVFKWIDIEDAIPEGSDRRYVLTPSVTKLGKV